MCVCVCPVMSVAASSQAALPVMQNHKASILAKTEKGSIAVLCERSFAAASRTLQGTSRTFTAS